LLAWTGEEEGSCSVVIFCCEEAGILGDSSVASSSLLIEISFDCSDSLTKSINKSEEQSKTLENKDPESSLKLEEPNKKETSNRETSSEDTKSQQQASF
jgi:hypothetical protein